MPKYTILLNGPIENLIFDIINRFYYYNKIFFIITKITVSENCDVDHGMSWMNESYEH